MSTTYWRERVEGTDELWQWGENTTVWGDRVQPTPTKYFHVLISSDAGESREAFEGRLKRAMFCLMGDIEERDVGV